MKILFLSKYKWPHVGGVEKHIEMLSRVLTKRGHQIKVLTDEDVWKHQKLFDWADIIHVHDVFYRIFYLRLFYWHSKFFITFHGWEEIYPVPWKNIIIRKISEFLAKGNICVGEFIKKYYFTKPDFIIYGATTKRRKGTEVQRRKGAIYVGRGGKDLEYFKNLAKKMKIKLDVYVKDPKASKYFYKYRYAFVSGYLTILEAMSQGAEIRSYSDNKLKQDYLEMTPFKNPGYKIPEWKDVADVYEKLWKK